MSAMSQGTGSSPNNPPSAQPNVGHKAAMGMGRIALILGIVALVLGGSGVALALTHAGPTGPTGAKGDTGDQGPAGPGAVVEQSYNDGTTVMAGTCTYYLGSNLSFTVSTPGTFVMTASLVLFVGHTTGYAANIGVSLANASATCSLSGNAAMATEIASTEVTAIYQPDISLVQSFVVGAAGTYTFGVIGEATGGGPSDYSWFYYASVVGVFYPS